MIFLEIKNWTNFQHYKNRNPPWIKLHYELITSHDWVMWDDASKMLAVVCMMIASRNEGKVPADEFYIQKVAHLQKKPDLNPLIESGFFVDASMLQADASTKTETEAYKQEEKKPTKKVPVTLAEWELANGELTLEKIPKFFLKHGSSAHAHLEKFRYSCLASNRKYLDFTAAIQCWDWSSKEIIKPKTSNMHSSNPIKRNVIQAKDLP